MKKQPKPKCSPFLLRLFHKTLKRYKENLDQNPGSFFYQGLIKNTEEFIKELKK